MGVTMKILEAGNGDSILIQCGEDESKMKTILIDGGIQSTYSRVLKGELADIFEKNQIVDLLFVTHTHGDHIAGIIDLFEDETIDKQKIDLVLFNSKSILKKEFESLRDLSVWCDNGEVSILSEPQGDKLEGLLSQTKWHKDPVSADKGTMELELKEGVKLTFLAPRLTIMATMLEAWNEEMQTAGFMHDGVALAAWETDYHRSIPELLDNEFTEDDTPENRSSIAFLLEYCDVKLFTAGRREPVRRRGVVKGAGFQRRKQAGGGFCEGVASREQKQHQRRTARDD